MRSIQQFLKLFVSFAISTLLVSCQTIAAPRTKLENYLYRMPSNPCDDAVYIRNGSVCIILLNLYIDDQKGLTPHEKMLATRTLCKSLIDGTFFMATGDRGTDFFMCIKDMKSAEAEYEQKLKYYHRTQI